jgi:hypothetical protein
MARDRFAHGLEIRHNTEARRIDGLHMPVIASWCPGLGLCGQMAIEIRRRKSESLRCGMSQVGDRRRNYIACPRVMDQALRSAGAAASRVTAIVAGIASPDRSGHMNFAPVSVRREFGLGRSYRPDKARQLTRHRDADLVDLHASAAQTGETASEPQLRLPGHVADTPVSVASRHAPPGASGTPGRAA